HSSLGRLQANGVVDTGFTANADCEIYSLALEPDGKILVGGYFSMLAPGGSWLTNLVRVYSDGTLDTGFAPNADSPVWSLAVQPRYYLARLNADGTLDTGFNPGVNALVNALAIQADGKVLVGGEFSYLGGWARYCLGRLNATEPATQNLTADATTITWLRGG